MARAGFTRVELTVGVVMLAIIGAVAVPRFNGYQAEARVAAVKHMGGTLKSAANMAHEVCMAQACENGSVIVIQGEPITFVDGYPNDATVGRLVRNMEQFTANETGNTFTRNGSRSTQCWVGYRQATVVNGAVQPPTIVYPGGTVTDAASENTVNNALRRQC
jgi:Tfp pilus assembly protein FimT